MSNYYQNSHPGNSRNEYPNIETNSNGQTQNTSDTPTNNFDQYLNLSPAGDTPVQTQFPSNFHQYRPNTHQYSDVLANSGKIYSNSPPPPPILPSQQMHHQSQLQQQQLQQQQLHQIQIPHTDNIQGYNQQVDYNTPTVQQQFNQLDLQQANITQFSPTIAQTPPIIIETPPELRTDYQTNNIPTNQYNEVSSSSNFQPPQIQITSQEQSHHQQSKQSNKFLNIDFNNPSFNQPQSHHSHSPASPFGGSVMSELSSVENSPYLSSVQTPADFRDDHQLFSIDDNTGNSNNDDNSNNIQTIDGVGLLEFNSLGAGLNNVSLSAVASEVSFQDVIGPNGVTGQVFDIGVIRGDGLTDNISIPTDNNVNTGVFGDDQQNWKLTQDNLMINDERISKQQINGASPVTISIEISDHELNFNKPAKVESLFSNSNKSSRANSRANSESSHYFKSGHFNDKNKESNYSSNNGVFEDDDDDDYENEEGHNNKSKSYLTVDDQQHSNMRQSRQRRQSSNSRSNHSRSRSKSISRIPSNTSTEENREKMLELASPLQQPKRTQKHPSIYACHLCDKRFTRPYNLKSHLRTHTDERPFVCSVCGKAFARQHDRKRHEDLHSGNKKYQCLGTLRDGVTQWGCGKKFARTDALGRHFKTEAGKECIRPLIEENEREKKGMGHMTSRSGSNLIIPKVEITKDDGDVLPDQLYDRYPALLQNQ